MPAYNRSATILAALESIRAQTYSNWETIVVDDGSTDNTAGVVKRAASLDKRISLIQYNCNRGAQAARNTGIHRARGEWIAFLDSDDQYLPESLQIRLDLAKKEMASVVHTRGYIVPEEGQTKIYNTPALKGWVHKELLIREGPTICSLLIRKEALERIGYLDETITSFQEWDTSIRLAKVYPFSFAPEPTYIYDYRTAGAMSRSAIRNAKGYEQVVCKHLPDILRYAGPEALLRHYRVAAGLYKKGNQRYNARRCELTGLAWICLSPRKVLGKIGSLILTQHTTRG